MTVIDYVIFGIYLAGVLAMGIYHYRRNTNSEDYYVGGRSMGARHIGLSIVATDVGGGFSIGLGGLGFIMGLAGSWLLFTGLIGAWLAAVLVLPRVKAVDRRFGLMTYPDLLRHRYGERVALVAALVSGVGYLGFTAGQILAGAKLASATILTVEPWGMSTLDFSLLVIALVTVLYTVSGGLKAVIFTDTIQWSILLVGLIVVAVPVVLWGELGGISELRRTLPPAHFSLGNVSPVQLINWGATIIPIWLIGMTLYQRMYACRDLATAKRAWYLAGLLEWPVMAFLGVFLGMCARVLFPEVEPEMGLPLLISQALPAGIAGLLAAAYFSAIMSTADSCLMAASGNFVGDILHRRYGQGWRRQTTLRVSQGVTLLVGAGAVLLAGGFTRVLDIILQVYAFMVSGLLASTVGALFWHQASAVGAMAGLVGGGAVTLSLQAGLWTLPTALQDSGLDPIVFGLAVSIILFVGLSLAFPDQGRRLVKEVNNNVRPD
ncbi:MAG: sodium:solute symporter family protein [Candidatus Krumholzibacteria bacterium]|jgi:SSS family solute:Na+ symporter|nr:sodium:solute symporter family protein [Candidatus Krumholzibacteria bacterium]